MRIRPYRIAAHITLGILLAVLAVMVYTMINTYIGLVHAQPQTSFPPSSAFVLVGMYFALPVLVLLAAWVVLRLIIRKLERKSS